MKDLNQTLLRQHQRSAIEKDIQQSEAMLPKAKDEGVAILQSSIRKAKKQLNEQSPEPLTGKEKDTLNQLEKRLRQKITTNMPPEEVMRKNPAGAVDWHTRWEKANKKLIKMWKNVRIQLSPDSQDRDLANIERYRPSGTTDRLRTDAQIAGHMSYSSVPDENWPFDAPENTALAQAKQRYEDHDAESAVNNAIENFDKEEDARILADEEAKTEEKKPVTPEQHAILVQRLANARAIQKKMREEERQVDKAMADVPVVE
jgi:hypothetical protein